MYERLQSELRLTLLRARKALRLAQDPGLWRAARRGVVASVEHAPVPFAARPATVLDVGASKGQFALFAARRFPTAHIVSFEPYPDSQRVLERVLGGRVELHPVALSRRAGKAPLQVSVATDSSSLLPIGERQTREFPGTGANGTIEVEVSTLDVFLSDRLKRPVLLKIDVQGAELDVLQGAGSTLRFVDEVFVECSFVELYSGQALADEVIGFLKEAGFRLRGIFGAVYGAGGVAIQADFLFDRY